MLKQILARLRFSRLLSRGAINLSLRILTADYINEGASRLILLGGRVVEPTKLVDTEFQFQVFPLNLELHEARRCSSHPFIGTVNIAVTRDTSLITGNFDLHEVFLEELGVRIGNRGVSVQYLPVITLSISSVPSLWPWSTPFIFIEGISYTDTLCSLSSKLDLH